MKLKIALIAAALLPSLAMADEAIQQIEEVVVTGAVRSNDAVQVAAINLPGDAELVEMPVIVE